MKYDSHSVRGVTLSLLLVAFLVLLAWPVQQWLAEPEPAPTHVRAEGAPPAPDAGRSVAEPRPAGVSEAEPSTTGGGARSADLGALAGPEGELPELQAQSRAPKPSPRSGARGRAARSTRANAAVELTPPPASSLLPDAPPEAKLPEPSGRTRAAAVDTDAHFRALIRKWNGPDYCRTRIESGRGATVKAELELARSGKWDFDVVEARTPRAQAFGDCLQARAHQLEALSELEPGRYSATFVF